MRPFFLYLFILILAGAGLWRTLRRPPQKEKTNP